MMKFILTLLMALSVLPSYAQTGAYALYDYSAISYLINYRERDIRSIASITKLFTANAVLRSEVNLEEKIKVNGRSNGRVPRGVYMSRIDLMRAMIISSDNRAAETLANHHPGGFNQFIKDVNIYLDNNALYDTKIVDSTGLLSGNTSTARDLVEFLFQIKDDPVIRKIAN
jgi:D-alanyl-D-alanine endopeptidase (penicillin-binding protein 7)